MAYTTIKKPSDYFNTKLYTGDGTNARGITGVGFQPDFTWIKRRSADAYHFLTDAVRGATKTMYSNTGDAEATQSLGLQSFDSDGFTVGSNADVNGNTQTFVGWNWLGANGTAANTDGTISSTVSANTTSGFSIVKYTGTSANATVGHGLSTVPKMIIVKNLDQADDWYVYHVSRGATQHIILNSPGIGGSNATLWQNTEPTSSVFSIGTNNVVNTSGENYIAYCFAEKQGFSKFGSYTGNGSTDGTFVYTGFKPAFLMQKNTAAADSWEIRDVRRHLINDDTRKVLRADTSGAESVDSGAGIDILSNGFKPRYSGSSVNGSGVTYIYMAFAEEPLVGDNPATAR